MYLEIFETTQCTIFWGVYVHCIQYMERFPTMSLFLKNLHLSEFVHQNISACYVPVAYAPYIPYLYPLHSNLTQHYHIHFQPQHATLLLF